VPGIKICGLWREPDVEYVNEAGPEYAGFVFAPSRRQVSPQRAEELRAGLRAGIVPVGVFVNAPVAEIRALVADGIIDLAQLHGDEDEGFVAELRDAGVPVIKAVRVTGADAVAQGARSRADYVLYDHGPGGTGQSFDWGLLAEVSRPYFLAGGVNLRNIERAVALNPFAIDVSSGAEVDGTKDRDTIIALVRAAHGDNGRDEGKEQR
jgi:phosphoribosylanthranilate isomerase